jgi:hypothetical protein
MKFLLTALIAVIINGCNTLPPVTAFESEGTDAIIYTSDNINFEAGTYLEGVVFARDGYNLTPISAVVDTKKGVAKLNERKGENFYQLVLWKCEK